MGLTYSIYKIDAPVDTDEASIKRFQKYLQIKSAHPDPDYNSIIRYLKQAAEEIGLDFKTCEFSPANPIAVLTWRGSLPAILLNSHTDVVEAYAGEWRYDPYEAEIADNGNIYARGTQDTFVKMETDEEVGGKKGMEPFVKSEQFKALNVGVSLDEGHPSPTMDYHLYYAERSIRSMLESNPELNMGDVTTINLTEIKGGTAFNIIPCEMTCTIDIRVTPRVDLDEFEDLIDSWIKEAGSDITYQYLQRSIKPAMTSIEPGFKWWDALSAAAESAGISLHKAITGGSTDSRFLREIGIAAYGLSLINDTPLWLHSNDEFINKDVFLRGIEIYKILIPALANTPKFEPDPKD